MNEAENFDDCERINALIQSWKEVAPAIDRLSSGPARGAFFRRLLGEYSVLRRYRQACCNESISRYGAQLRMEGMRTMAFDQVAGAAEYVVGAHVESQALAAPDLRDIAAGADALIQRAVALCGRQASPLH